MLVFLSVGWGSHLFCLNKPVYILRYGMNGVSSLKLLNPHDIAVIDVVFEVCPVCACVPSVGLLAGSHCNSILISTVAAPVYILLGQAQLTFSSSYFGFWTSLQDEWNYLLLVLQVIVLPK